ncbi:ATP synthase F1 subunit delta [Crocinitomix catalasitica]|uniref:ATP synthase F1 subunit delta n=1 Tax=Crocinitomix catalasitica TaxID=184607 RepID=UPI00048671FE|nr:ATP synthase F1 subunit delta [Crocinitomix catalasitica]
MSVTKVAHRYAQALLDLSVEQNNIDKVNADMVELASICKTSKDFDNLLKSPIVGTAKKIDILNTIFTTKIEKVSLDFINLIVKNSRADILPEVAKGFVDLYKKKNNILDVKVISASPLDSKTKETIIAKIKTSFNGTIELIEEVDATLLGGFIVRIDDQQVDASIASQLASLKNILLN